MANAIQLQDVHKRYRVYRERYRSLKEIFVHRRLGEWEDRWALSGLSLEVDPGTTLGLLGANGAGKSTALKLMARILTPDRGSVRVNGRVSGLLELGAGFQLEYTGRENVFLNASLLGMSRRDVRRRFDDIVAFAELEDHIDAPLRTYSSGMHMRLGFAVAIHVEPDILLVDEVLAVGDAAFQKKCTDWLTGFQRRGGTVVIVTHSLGAVRELCEQAAWIGDGRLLALGEPDPVIDAYTHAVREQQIDAHGGTPEPGASIPSVEIGEIRLLDGHGLPVERLQSEESLTVEIPYRCYRRLETPVFGIAMHRADGAYVYGTNTAVDGLEMPPIEADGCIRLTYDALSLLAGSYVLTVAVFADERAGSVVDYREQYCRFRVLRATGEQGVSHLAHHWDIPTRSGKNQRVG